MEGKYKTIMVRSTLIAIACAGAGLVFSHFAGAEIFVGRNVTATVPLDQIEHTAWNELLQSYVDADGMVRYSDWKSNAGDREKLTAYLSTLSAADIHANSSQDASLAFWINAYNAVTIEGILREYPTSSIRNHTARLVGYNIWQDLKLFVGGRTYSLEDIEHRKLRTVNEPRIHFAIVCASVGCPRLLNEAYTADRLPQQLDENARHFFRQPRHFRYDAASRTLHLSSILNWFGGDFGASRAEQLQTIAPWLPTKETRRAAEQHATTSIQFLEYDWSLNDARTANR